LNILYYLFITEIAPNFGEGIANPGIKATSN